MRAALTVGGVLGVGTGLVFGLAAVTANVFPNGATVGGSMNGGAFGGNGVVIQNVGVGPNAGWQKIVNSDGSVTVVGPGQPVPVPMPMPTDPPSPDGAGGG